MARFRRKRSGRRRGGRKIRVHHKPKMFHSVALAATVVGGVVMITGVGASQTQQLLNAARSLPWVGQLLASGATIISILWLLKLVGGSWWEGKVRSILGPSWRP